MTRLLVQQKPRKQQGAPRKISEATVDVLVKCLDELFVKAGFKYTVATKLLKHSARAQVNERAIRDALRSRNVWLRILREEPTLTLDATVTAHTKSEACLAPLHINHALRKVTVKTRVYSVDPQ